MKAAILELYNSPVLESMYGPADDAGESGRAGWFATLTIWQKRYADRRRLLELDDRLLLDIGLSRAEVIAEASKPFWRD